jgi:spore maturation protein CgeB
MKVLVVGKLGSVAFWMENLVSAFQTEGCDTRGFSVTGDGRWGRLRVRLQKRIDRKGVAAVLARQFEAALRAFRPDLVVFTHAFWAVPLDMYQVARAMEWQPRLLGWVGDKFGADQRPKVELMDHLFFTDSGFFDDAARFGFPEHTSYLALAADPTLFHPGSGARVDEMLFVANCTPHREEVVRAVRSPVTVYGRGWKGLDDSIHHVHSHLISIHKVAKLYRRHRSVLNVLNELNLMHGLNQRNFEPLACKAVVISEQVRDMERCFEPGKEILVYDDMEELNDLERKVRMDEGFAGRIAEAGYRRVLAEHTYVHRVRAILKLVNA